MPLVSKRLLNKKVEERVNELFHQTISYLNSKEDIEDFLDDFLSPVEKIMLAKRISIALLLAKGYTYNIICELLKVTPPTVASVNIKLRYSGKGYKKITKKLITDYQKGQIMQKIEDLLQNIPPGKGRNWSSHRKEYEEKKRRQQKPF